MYKNMSVDEFVHSGVLVMVNQLLSWHGMCLIPEWDKTSHEAVALHPVKLTQNWEFNEKNVASAKRRMNRYMFNNAKEMIENEKMEELY